jgi:AraC-like DNA-binding protein
MPNATHRFTPRRPESITVSGRSGIQRLSWQAVIDSDRPDEFQATLCAVVFDEMALAWMRHTPARQVRSQATVDSIDVGSTIILVNHGPFLLRQDDTDLQADAGDLVVISGRQGYEITAPGGLDAISITLARSALTRFGTPPFEDETRTLPRTLLTDPLAGFVRALMADPPRPASVEGITAQRTLSQLLVGILTIGFRADAEPSAPRSAALVARAMTFISEFAQEPTLDIAQVATGIGTSPRTLQRLFTGAHTTVSNEIRAQRLRNALPSIIDHAYTPSALPDVAVTSGFGSVARLKRALSQVHGTTVSDYRARILQTTMPAFDRDPRRATSAPRAN